MSKQYVWKFIVTGRLAFPLDMLRYDCCYPATQVDVDQLQQSLDVRSRQDAENGFSVALVSRTGEPEARRWSSFGWHVKEIRKEQRS